VGQKQNKYGKGKIKISTGNWIMLKNKLMSMPAPPDEHTINYRQCTVDSKSKAVHYSRDGQLAMECYVDISEKYDDAKLRERLKVYTVFQIKYLQQEVLGQMFGVGPLTNISKISKGGRHQRRPSLQKAKRKGWSTCSDVFNNSAHSVEVGEIFPVDHVMYEVVHTSAGHETAVRRMDSGVFSTMNVAETICYLNESSIS
jgi:hypothetical protein